jgi:uncharacterized protein (TIGR03067 family)
MTAPALAEFAVASDTPTDLERLQGTWVVVSGRRQAEFVFSDYLFAVRFGDGDTYLGTFRLGPDVQPKTMDMRIDEGPAHHRSKIARCIYEVDGEFIRWCPAEPGSEERLTTFPGCDDSHHLCLVLQRQPS